MNTKYELQMIFEQLNETEYDDELKRHYEINN